MATTREASVQGTSQPSATRARVVKVEVQPVLEASVASLQERVKHLLASLLSLCGPWHVPEHQEVTLEAYDRPSLLQQPEMNHGVLVPPLGALACAFASEPTESPG